MKQHLGIKRDRKLEQRENYFSLLPSSLSHDSGGLTSQPLLILKVLSSVSCSSSAAPLSVVFG